MSNQKAGELECMSQCKFSWEVKFLADSDVDAID